MPVALPANPAGVSGPAASQPAAGPDPNRNFNEVEALIAGANDARQLPGPPTRVTPESEEVIDLSDDDVIGGLPPAPRNPVLANERNPPPDYLTPPALSSRPLAAPGAGGTPLNPEAMALSAGPQGLPAQGFQTHKNDAVPLAGIFAMLTGFAGLIFAAWLSFKSYQALSYYLPGSTINLQVARGGRLVALLFGIRLLGGLAMLAGCGLFLVNEIFRLVTRSNPMPFSPLLALLVSCFVVLVEFGLACYAILNLSAFAGPVGAPGTTSVAEILVHLLLLLLVPAAVITVSLIRNR